MIQDFLHHSITEIFLPGSLLIFSKGSTAIDLSIGSDEDLKSDGNKKYADTNSPMIMNDQKAILTL